jgi:hypothetical protein
MQITLDLDDASLDKLAAAITGHMSGDRAKTAPGATETRDNDDPWGSPGGTAESRSQGSTAPPERSVTVNGKTWTLNAPGAPKCQCGEPAAIQEGTGKKGPWQRWACARAAGDDWKSKCDYSVFL